MQISDSLKDLMIPFQLKWYYTPEMRGSYSIKFVLPALVPELSYNDLEIKEGVTLHEKDCEVIGNKEKGWVIYWQPHGESELGTAILTTKNYFINFETDSNKIKDLSNAYAHLNVINNTVIYYAGFSRKESGQFRTKKEWKNYLNKFSAQINIPLQAKIDE